MSFARAFRMWELREQGRAALEDFHRRRMLRENARVTLWAATVEAQGRRQAWALGMIALPTAVVLARAAGR